LFSELPCPLVQRATRLLVDCQWRKKSVNVGNTLSVEIAPYSLQRRRPTSRSGDNSTTFIPDALAQVFFQSIPVKIHKLKMAGLHNVRQIQKIIERRNVAEKT
jgi:hypothetical protein